MLNRRLSTKKEWKIVLIQFLMVTGFSVIWSVVIPPFQSPDEQSHFRFIEFIVEEGVLPGEEEYSASSGFNRSEDIRYFINKTAADKVFHNPNYHYDYINNTESRANQFNAALVLNHPPLYYIWGAFGFMLGNGISFGVAFLAVRFANIFIELAGVFYAYRVSKVLSRNCWFQFVFPLTVVLWPMYTFISSGINNDVLLFTSFIATFYYLIALVYLDKHVKQHLLGLALWMSVGMISKIQYITIIPVVFVVFLVLLRKGKYQLRDLVLPGTILSGTVAFYLRSLIVLGSFIPRPQIGETGIITDLMESAIIGGTSLSLRHYLRVLVYPRFVTVFHGFVGNFGWLDTLLPKEVFYIFLTIFLISFLGFVWYILDRFRKKKPIPSSILIFVGSILSLEVLYTFLFLRKYLSSGYMGFPTQGRYYFPILLPLFFCVFCGLRKLVTEKYENFLYKGIGVFVLLFQVYCLVFMLTRYYV